MCYSMNEIVVHDKHYATPKHKHEEIYERGNVYKQTKRKWFMLYQDKWSNENFCRAK